ncbi:MAG: hypothetical protein B7Z73_05410 [Planctomycetia bacterium 21-64-5]|nr:MAG: hypothetical protein B7Z73_05410 [Planctomycetia bacterium 21-64-5]HQU41810.1 hypothetical protein [Pirellulales bacterium]
MSDEDRTSQPELTPREIRQWAEFCCWTTLALAPFLYWVNGPAVSTDQFVVRTALVALAAAGAITLRVVAWRRRDRK